jgi:hypothetical protein
LKPVVSNTRSRSWFPTDTADFTLSEGERDVLAADAAAFARALSDPVAAARYERLAAAASSGVVPGELIAPLEAMLELLFARGRPSNRAVLQAVFSRTPRGKQQHSAAREVNRALQALRGQALADLRLSAGPSYHTLVIETDRCKLTLELDSAGARVSSLETG